MGRKVEALTGVFPRLFLVFTIVDVLRVGVGLDLVPELPHIDSKILSIDGGLPRAD